MSKDRTIRERAKAAVGVARCILNALFVCAVTFLTIAAFVVCPVAYRLHPYAALFVCVVLFCCGYYIQTRKESAATLLTRAEGVLEGGSEGSSTVETVRELLKSMVDNVFDTIVQTVVTIPVVLAAISALFAVFGYYWVAGFTALGTVCVAVVATCIYCALKNVALGQVDRLIDTVATHERDTSSTEKTPLLDQ